MLKYPVKGGIIFYGWGGPPVYDRQTSDFSGPLCAPGKNLSLQKILPQPPAKQETTPLINNESAYEAGLKYLFY